jgi:hypothetical protein
MLHMPQKHKATVPDSTLRIEMDTLESKLTATRPASLIGSPSHGSGPSGPPLPMTLGIMGDVCVATLHWVWRCRYSAPSPAATNARPPCAVARTA